MIEVENDYEPVLFEQPFHSHINANHFELLLDYYNRLTSNNIPLVQEIKEINTVHTETNLKKTKYHVQAQITFIRTYKKKHQKKKFGQSHFF